MKASKEKLLVVAMVIAPFTLLRFGIMGFAEVLVLLVFFGQAMKGLRRSLFNDFVLTKFWLLYLPLSMLGLAANQWLYSTSTSTARQIMFDAGAYVFILCTCYALERLATHSSFDVRRFAHDVFVWSTTVFLGLYIASLFTPSLFGLPLKHYDYFVPWAENLHQVSMTLVPLPFLGLAVASETRNRAKKALLFVLSVLAGLMAVRTGSSKAVLAMYVGVFAMAYSFALVKLGKNKLIQVNLAFGVIALLVVAGADWVRVGEQLFEENDVGGMRDYLYGHAVDLGLESLLIGRGPGPHIALHGSYLDAHQSFLTAVLQAGFLGAGALVVLLARIGRRVLYHPPLLAAFSGLLIYAAGGDILRRLPAWIMLFILCHYVPAERLASARTPVAGSSSTVARGQPSP